MNVMSCVQRGATILKGIKEKKLTMICNKRRRKKIKRFTSTRGRSISLIILQKAVGTYISIKDIHFLRIETLGAVTSMTTLMTRSIGTHRVGIRAITLMMNISLKKGTSTNALMMHIKILDVEISIVTLLMMSTSIISVGTGTSTPLKMSMSTVADL